MGKTSLYLRSVRGMPARNTTCLRSTQNGKRIWPMCLNVFDAGPLHHLNNLTDHRPRVFWKHQLRGLLMFCLLWDCRVCRLPGPRQENLRSVMCSDPLWKTLLWWKFGTDAAFGVTLLKANVIKSLALFIFSYIHSLTPSLTHSPDTSHILAAALQVPCWTLWPQWSTRQTLSWLPTSSKKQRSLHTWEVPCNLPLPLCF